MVVLVVALGLLLVLGVVLLNKHGRKLARHDEYLERLDIVLGNLHEERRRNYVQSLQRKTRRTPAPIPPGTIQVSDDMLIVSDDTPKPKPKDRP